MRAGTGTCVSQGGLLIIDPAGPLFSGNPDLPRADSKLIHAVACAPCRLPTGRPGAVRGTQHQALPILAAVRRGTCAVNSVSPGGISRHRTTYCHGIQQPSFRGHEMLTPSPVASVLFCPRILGTIKSLSHPRVQSCRNALGPPEPIDQLVTPAARITTSLPSRLTILGGFRVQIRSPAPSGPPAPPLPPWPDTGAHDVPMNIVPPRPNAPCRHPSPTASTAWPRGPAPETIVRGCPGSRSPLSFSVSTSV